MPIPLGILAVAGAGAAGGADYVRLESTILTSPAANVTFSSLGSYSAYKHLQIRGVVKSNRTAFDLDTLDMQLNSDTGTNYAYHTLSGNGSSVSSSGIGSQARIQAITIPGNVAANIFSPVVIDILDFSATTKNTTVRLLGGINNPEENSIRLISGLWNNTAAVTTINLICRSGSFVAGSRFSLYGIR